MNTVFTYVFLITIVLLLKFIFSRKTRRFHQLLKQFPSHPTYPLIGNLHLLWNSKKGLLEKLETIVQPYDRQVFWFGSIPILFLSKYDDIATILSQCQDRDTMGKTHEWLGIGLLTARGEEWKTSRRILNLAFTSEMLSKYLQVFNKNASILVKNLKSEADTGETIQVFDWMMKVSLDSIVENVMGICLRNSDRTEQGFCNAIRISISSVQKRIECPWLFPNLVYKLYLKITEKNKIIDQLKFLPLQILRRKMNEFKERTVDEGSTKSSRTVLDLLVKLGQKEPDFTETRMRDELLHIIAAGIETTATNLSFLLLMLAIHQDAQQKVYEEITKLSKSHDLTENDLTNHLGYLEQCIKETLRMFSPVAVTFRRTDKDILLGDKTVPANMFVGTYIHKANYDKQLYKDPLKWDPERFNDLVIGERPKASQLNFGSGPRYCLGAKYAMMSIKTQIVHILRRYQVSTNIKELTPEDLHLDLSIRSKLGYPIKFTSRPEARI